MNARTHGEMARFIWSICNLLRGPYKRNEYRGNPEPDPERRDTETVPLREDIDEYMAREVQRGGVIVVGIGTGLGRSRSARLIGNPRVAAPRCAETGLGVLGFGRLVAVVVA